jgi:hypothetical protein
MPMRSAARTSASSFGRLAGVKLDQVVELRPVTQHAENDFGGQAGVARIERRGAFEKQV